MLGGRILRGGELLVLLAPLHGMRRGAPHSAMGRGEPPGVLLGCGLGAWRSPLFGAGWFFLGMARCSWWVQGCSCVLAPWVSGGGGEWRPDPTQPLSALVGPRSPGPGGLGGGAAEASRR